MLLINSYRFGVAYDTDAQTYITAVETADGASLETGVKDAINAFVVGCKADGIWNAIKASCILSGARTLPGALVPLVGTAPTNFNFVAGDYNRKTGLAGDGSTKYLDSNRDNYADPRNSKHMSAHVTTAPTVTSCLIGARQGQAQDQGSSQIIHVDSVGSNFRINSAAVNSDGQGIGVGLAATSRSSSTAGTWRHSASRSGSISTTSEAPHSINIHVFQRSGSLGNAPTNARLAFYSIGESLNLALLDARVTLLMAGIQAGIDGFDADAQAYITAVEAADAQPLEYSVKSAINSFVVDCKTDGTWNAIKASCILAGARTLAGALVPLKGAAPTNFNFVAGDYNRKTGLVGNGTSKYLNSNRNNNADPQDSQHMAVYASSATTSAAARYPTYIGAGGASTGTTAFARNESNGTLFARNRSSSFDLTGGGGDVGLIAVNRSTSSAFTFRRSGSSISYTRASQTPFDGNLFVYNANVAGSPASDSYSNARLAFYSIGESLNLALLDARVTALVAAFAAAIP